MTATLALAAALALSPAQAGALTVTNARHTYRELGPTRTDLKYMPGDVVFIAFDIEGLKMGPDGRIVYGMGMEVLDKAGLAVQKFPPSKAEEFLPLGGTSYPAFVYVPIMKGQQPGPYTIRVTVTDVATNATKVVEQKYEVVPPTFGLVNLYVALDEGGITPCGMVGVAGQTVHVLCDVTGFSRDLNKKHNTAIEFRVLDQSGKPTVAQPRIVEIPRDLSERDEFYRVRMRMPLNREGSFTVELKAADKISGKTATLTFPLKVHPASK